MPPTSPPSARASPHSLLTNSSCIGCMNATTTLPGQTIPKAYACAQYCQGSKITTGELFRLVSLPLALVPTTVRTPQLLSCLLLASPSPACVTRACVLMFSLELPLHPISTRLLAAPFCLPADGLRDECVSCVTSRYPLDPWACDNW